MTAPSRPRPASPRWPILATLASGVLGVHLILLAGGIPLPWPGAHNTTTATAAAPPATANTDADTRTTPTNTPGAPAVHVSTVRWIVPTPAAAAAPAAVAAPKPRPAPRPALPAREQAVKATAPAQVAAVEPYAPPPVDTQETPVPVEAEAIALTSDALVASAASPESPVEPPPVTASNDMAPLHSSDEPVPSEEADDTLVAAAATTRSRATTATAKLPPAQVPASTRLQYDVVGNIKGIGYRAEGLLDWTVADGRYDARLEMRVMLLGSRSQTSTGRIGPQGLMPERFADRSRSEKATHFDATQQRIRFSNNAPEVPLQAGAQDRLSLFMQLAGLLQARPQAYTTGQVVNMQVAGTGDAPVWRFEVGEASTLRVPAGEFQVRHVVRQPRKEFDSTVEMWLAPDLGHMPVRLRITQPNGDVADQKLRQLP